MEQEWLARYEQIKDKLISPVDYGAEFAKAEAYGKRLFVLPIGEVYFPTGEVVVCDPLTGVYWAKPFMEKVPVGRFPLELLVVEVEEDHYRYAMARVRFSNRKAVVYREPLKGDEDLSEFEEGDFFGFAVDAGLASVMDVQTHKALLAYDETFDEGEANWYDDVIAPAFEVSRAQYPLYQDEATTWVQLPIPNTEFAVPMFSSGWGDGAYPVYYGYDAEGVISELVIEFRDLKLTFEEEA